MRSLFLLAASTLALGAAGCAPKAPVARTALDCPAKQGELSRTFVSPDGKVCNYTGAGGVEVTLQLVSTAGGADKALSDIEANLLAGRAKPQDKADGKAGEADTKATDKGADGKTADDRAADDKAAKSAGANATDAAARAEAQAKGDSGHITIETRDGKTIVHADGGDRDGNVQVNLPGVHVKANERDEQAEVTIGPIHINAGDDGATVRMRRDVRLRGEALSRERRGVRATFIYTGEDLPEGYRFVGYEAGGPKAGPITVAIVKSKLEGPGGNEIYPDVKRLVRRNGGV